MSGVLRKVIRVDGSEQLLDRPHSIREINSLIGANGLDTVQLRHLGRPAHVMLVDDTGMVDGKPVNEAATKLYWANCRPGTTHPICGDVVVVPDGDYA